MCLKLVVCSLVAVACTPKAKQYTLRVDLADQTNTQLCSRETDTNAKNGTLPDPKCRAFGGQALTAPATLTVSLQNPSPDAHYDLRISQFSREANPSDAQKILATVIQHAAELAQQIAKEHGEQLLSDAATKVASKAPDVAKAVVGRLSSTTNNPLPPRAEPAKIFKPIYFDPAAKKLKTAAESRSITPPVASIHTNAPQPLPPPRTYQLGDADVAFLAAAGVSADQLGDFVIEWCAPTSFQATADAARYTALATAPQPDGVRTALDINAKDIAQILLAKGNADVVMKRIQALIDEGKDWDKASSAAKTFATMTLGKTLASDLRNCQDNIAFLASKVTANVRTKLEQLASNSAFVALNTNAQKYAGAFDEVFGPLFQDAFVETEHVVKLASTAASTTLSVEPGRLEIGVGQTDANGKRTDLSSYKVQVRGIERLAILLGPVATYCSWGCFDRIQQIAQQPAMAGDPVRPVLDQAKHTHDFSLATALHVTFWQFSLCSADFGLGGVLGYPIGSANGTSSNVLVGLGLRHSSGIELSVGLHAFSARVLKSAYKTPIDLTVEGNQGLSIDSVTEDAPQWAAFAMIGFAPDVFSAAKE
jgi:hypothetical protein